MTVHSVPDATSTDLDLARSLATTAAEIAMGWYRKSDLAVETKNDGSPVTIADKTIERALRERLATEDPVAAIVGEEEGNTRDDTATRQWYLDPIDGTASFIRGVPLFSTLIALHDEHGPAVGVIALPALDEVVVAGRGLGCSSNGSRCRESEQSEMGGAVITTWGYEAWPLDALERLHHSGANMRGWGDGYGWALTATDQVDAVVDFDTNSWDLAPMPVIIGEAGGCFGTPNGGTTIDAGAGIGTNDHLHDAVLAVVNG